MKETVTRTIWVDNIRLIATIAVVIVHVAGNVALTQYDPHSTDNTNWYIANVYDSLCRCCVPLFVMLTGALLLPQQIVLADFLKKRLNRILFPFIFWSLIYIVFYLALKVMGEGQRAFNGIGEWLLIQITQGASPHLWYVYMIIGLYLFIPVIKPWAQSAGNKEIVYFLCIWFITILFNQQTLLVVSSPFGLSYFTGYIGYLVLGYYIANRMVITKKVVFAAGLLFITGFIVTLTATSWYTQQHGKFTHAFYEYLTFNVLFMAIGAFVFVKYKPYAGQNRVFNFIRTNISRYGYGIYLSHLLILSILVHFNVNYNVVMPLIGIPVVTIICLTLSMATVYLISLLPWGKYISG